MDAGGSRELLRFLILEDQEDDALLLIRHLKSSYQFDWVLISTEQELINALKESWDIIFSDYSLPSFSGLRALELTRQQDTDVPFIFISGTISEEMAVNAMSLGAQDFVMKNNNARLVPAVQRELSKIKARRQAEAKSRRLTAILEATPDLVIILEPDGHVRYLNESAREHFKVPIKHTLNGLNLKNLLKEPTVSQFMSEIFPAAMEVGYWTGERRLHIFNGKELPVSIVVLAHRSTGGEINYLSVTARDITERMRYELELQHRANYDNLTDLPNRYFLTDRFTLELERADRDHKCVGVLFLDLDNFKKVNDSLGHEAGDNLLKQVSRRIQSCLRPNDTVARIGGDEFTIIAGGLDSPQNMLTLLRRLRKSFEQSYNVVNQEIFVTFSAGIAVYPNDGNNVSTLLRNADTAMYKTKRMGANLYSFYSSDMNRRGHELLLLETELNHAIARDELILHYQPQFHLTNERVIGFEALLRWQHPDRGLISPGDFIPLLESTGLIVSVGEKVLVQACRTYNELKKSCINIEHIGVNVSTAQFNDTSFVEMVRNILIDEGVSPNCLQLEITENLLMQNPADAIHIISELSSMGVSIAIDDFGTGYSSLAYLKNFPLQVLKIDKTFVNDFDKQSKDAAIIKASIALGQEMGFQVLAEGVEHENQLSFLKQHKCDLVQGYLIGKPVPIEEIINLPI